VALTRLGPTYGEARAVSGDAPGRVGIALARDLESLQDKMAPFPQAEPSVRSWPRSAKPLSEVSPSFGPAVAAASIAQGASRRVENTIGRSFPRKRTPEPLTPDAEHGALDSPHSREDGRSPLSAEMSGVGSAATRYGKVLRPALNALQRLTSMLHLRRRAMPKVFPPMRGGCA